MLENLSLSVPGNATQPSKIPFHNQSAAQKPPRRTSNLRTNCDSSKTHLRLILDHTASVIVPVGMSSKGSAALFRFLKSALKTLLRP